MLLSFESEKTDSVISEAENENVVPLNRDEVRNRLNVITSPLADIGPINSLLISQHGELVTENYYGRMIANMIRSILIGNKVALLFN